MMVNPLRPGNLLHQKLFSKQHVPDIAGSSNVAADTPMTRKGMIIMLEATCIDETMDDVAASEEEGADSDAGEEESDSSE
ncbi:hypothetical protein L195_g047351, partial [Trifolium pratense]